MANLLEETRGCIKRFEHTEQDIVFIGSVKSRHSCTWEQFVVIADVVYDSGYGGQEVGCDLMIAFENGDMMVRGEYDGSEWWDVIPVFEGLRDTKPLTKLVRGSGWDSTLESINKEGEDND